MEIGWRTWPSRTNETLFQERREKDPSSSALELQGDDRAAERERLLSACTEFEALFLEMLIKGMRKTVPQGTSRQGELYQGLLDEELARLLSTRGIGLAQMMMRRLSLGASSNHPEDGPQVFPNLTDIYIGNLGEEDPQGVSSMLDKGHGEER